MDTVYDSHHVDASHRIEAALAAQRAQDAQHPDLTGVISRNYAALGARDQSPGDDKPDFMQSSLAGMVVPAGPKMTPYFGGAVRQNVDPLGNHGLLERYTGMTGAGEAPPKSKREVEPLFQPQMGVGNVYGSAVTTNLEREHLVLPFSRNNTLPFEQQRVGPGLDAGYTAAPSGGYNSGLDAREYAMPLDTDAIRAATNPKQTFGARTIAGAELIKARGLVGAIETRVAAKFKENTSDDLFRTTGANLKNMEHAEQVLRDVNRTDTTREYTGVAGPGAVEATYVSDTHYTTPARRALDAFSIGPAQVAGTHGTSASGDKDDYGRSTIEVFANERDTTTVPTALGNATSMIKALITPWQDLVRPAKRGVLETAAGRAYGNAHGGHMPAKQTVRDPGDVLRTTIRETTGDALSLGIVGGNARRLQIYDPDDVARVTMRQMLVQQAESLNLRGGAYKGTVHDPDAVARTTLKEQLLHDTEGWGTIGTVERRSDYREPDDATRPTTRETLDDVDTGINLRGAGPTRTTARDPDAVVRPTTKETTSVARDAQTDGTAVGGLQGRVGGYETAEYDAAVTRKETLEDGHVRQGPVGTGVRTAGDGYRVAEAMPRKTQKAELSDHDYVGAAASQGPDATTLRNDYDNARIDSAREELEEDRAPTNSGLKSGVVVEAIGDVDVRSVRQDMTDAAAQWTALGRPVPGAVADSCDEGRPTRTRQLPILAKDTLFEDTVAAAAAQRMGNHLANDISTHL